MLIVECSRDEVNGLLHITEAKERDLQMSAEIIGRLFAKHNVEKLLAVTRLHNHYQLKDGEKVVISLHPDDGSVPRGYEKNPKKVILKHAMQCADHEVVPVNFLMKPNGSLFGVEYMSCELARLCGLQETINNVLKNNAFLTDLSKAMVTHKLCDKLGFQFIFEPRLLPQDIHDSHLKVNLMEDNWEDGHQEIMFRPPPSEGNTPTITSWRFTRKCVCKNITLPCECDSIDHGDCDGYCWCLSLGREGHGGHAWHSNCG